MAGYSEVAFFVPWVLEVRSLTLCVLHTFPVHFLALRGSYPVSSPRVKPRPNDSNMCTQRIATLATLGAICCARLAALLRRVAPCCLLLAQIWSSWANNTQHRLAGGLEMRSLTGCVLHAFRMHLFVRFPLSSLHSISSLTVCTGIPHIRDRYIFLQQNFYSL